MSKGTASDPKSPEVIHVLILCLHQDMGANCLQTICPDVAEGTAHALVDGQNFDLDVYANEPDETPGWEQKIVSADVVVLLVRFMDAVSMERIKAMCERLPTKPALPMAVFLLREEGEVDFKMSCPSCGQKLWVRDTDEGKRGRCPNCKKAFRLPAQADHTQAELRLSDKVSVTRITRGNPTSCRKALGQVKELLATTQGPLDPDILMKSTVRIEVQNTDTEPGVDAAG